MGRLPGIVVGVHDGDTCHVDVTFPVRSGLRVIETFVIRLYGINAPELRALGGDASFVFLSDMINGKHVELEMKGADKYGGRFDGVLWLNGVNVNELMVSSGHAVVMKC